MWAATVTVLSLLWKGFVCEDVSQYYTINVSDNFPAQRGLCVLFPCTFTYDDRSESPDNPRGFWFRNDRRQPCFGMRVACNPQCTDICADARDRFRLVGDPLKRDCSLRIEDVRDSDGGDYYFRYENSATSRIRWNYRYNYKLLHVEVQGLTDKPEVTLPDGIIEGQEVTVNCTPPGRCLGTPPTITWNIEFSSTYHEHLYLIDYNNGTKYNISSITFTASRKDHRKYLNCTAVFPAEGVSTTRLRLLIIQYPPLAPEIRAFITGRDGAVETHNTSSVFIREGFNITLLCTADSNPASNLTWMQGDKILNISDFSSNNTLELNIININSSRDGGVYQCHAVNERGKANRPITVNVQYRPRIPKIDIEMVPASDNAALQKNYSAASILEGKTFSMVCAVDSVPTASLTWTKEGDTEILTSVNQRRLAVTLENITPAQDGRYWCLAKNELGTANASLLIIVEYKPKLVAGYKPSCQKEHNNVTCVCMVMANPLPAIRWKVNKVTLPEAFMTGAVIQEFATDNDTKTSILWLNVSEVKDLNVLCQFANKHGDGAFNLLGEDGTSQASYLSAMIGGGLAGFVVIAAVVMLGWLSIRKGRRTKHDNINGNDKQEMVDDDTPIYSQVHKAPKSPTAVSNDGANYQPSSGRDANMPTDNLYGNFREEDLQYASIDFSKLKPRSSPVQPTEDILYADVKMK